MSSMPRRTVKGGGVVEVVEVEVEVEVEVGEFGG
jgi:hypothetical protein